MKDVIQLFTSTFQYSTITFQTFTDSKELKKTFKGNDPNAQIYYAKQNELGNTLGMLSKVNAQKPVGIYFMVNEGDGKGRSAKNVVRVRAVFVDLDGSPLDPVMKYSPHIVVETSPGKYHAYWLIDGCNLSQFGPIQKALAIKFDGDPSVCDLSRVMRLPDSYHHKGEPFKSNIIHLDESATPIPVDQLIESLELEIIPETIKKDSIDKYSHGVPEGGRNTALTKVSGFCIAMGWSIEETINHCLKWNQSNNPPLCEEEVITTVKSIHKTHMRNHPEGLPTKFTDVEVAEYLKKKYGWKLQWWQDAKKWLVYDGGKWDAYSRGGAYPDLNRMIKELGKESQKLAPDQFLAINKSLKQLESQRRQEAILAAASKMPEMIVNSSMLDVDPMLLNCLNGTIDLITGELRPHHPGDLITRQVNLEYDENEKCPVFLKFLNRVLGGNQPLIDYLQRFIGYCLTGSTKEQVFLFLYGTGANGKTTLGNIIENLLGDLATTAGSTLLIGRRQSGASNDLAGLRGTRMVKVSEFNEDENLDEAMTKTLTGEDSISCRFLYAEHFVYRPTYKVLMLGNYKPRIKGRDHGIWRRIHLLPFKVTIPEKERDPDLTTKLEAELPEILAWAVQGCLKWQKIGLMPPAEVLNEVNAYKHAENYFQSWLDECCELDDNYSCSAKDLLQSFNEFTGQKVSHKKFAGMLKEAGFTNTKVKGSSHWIGLTVN